MRKLLLWALWAPVDVSTRKIRYKQGFFPGKWIGKRQWAEALLWVKWGILPNLSHSALSLGQYDGYVFQLCLWDLEFNKWTLSSFNTDFWGIWFQERTCMSVVCSQVEHTGWSSVMGVIHECEAMWDSGWWSNSLCRWYIPEYNGLVRDVKAVFLCRLYRYDLGDNEVLKCLGWSEVWVEMCNLSSVLWAQWVSSV